MNERKKKLFRLQLLQTRARLRNHVKINERVLTNY